MRISTDRVTVDVDPDDGGRLTQLWADGTPILVGRGDDIPDLLRHDDGTPQATGWGLFPMVPWAGRIRHGRFTFRGREYALPVEPDGHAIHGVGCSSEWTVTHSGAGHVRLALELPTDRRWPFGGHVVQDVSVVTDRLLLSMEVTADDQAFPVSFGWHPWFRTPDRVDFHPARMYRRDHEGIAVDELVAVQPGPWDDCFTNTLPIGLTVDGVDLRLTSDCTRWVVFDELPHATCVEPQTGPPDAFTLEPRVLEPGQSHSAWFQIELVPSSARTAAYSSVTSRR